MIRFNLVLTTIPIALMLFFVGCKTPSAEPTPQVSATDWAEVLGQAPVVNESQLIEKDHISNVAFHSSKQQPAALHVLGKTESLEELVREAPGTVLIDFYADWCGPCQRQSRVLHDVEQFAANNQARMIKVDVDAHKSLAKKYNVGSLPTLVVVRNGKVVDRKMGLQSEAKIKALLR